MIAALYVQKGGSYFNREGIDPWDEARDARTYAGNDPVVAHPPCSRWCRLAGLVEARWGHKRGDDGGCFAAALEAVRRCGGVLEHPAYSDAWKAFDLPRPPRGGGWVGDDERGYSCHVEQGRYGHPAKKATWLYAHGIPKPMLPELKWGSGTDRAMALVSWCGNHVSSGETRPRVGKAAASKTPDEFREVLIAMAESARRDATTPARELAIATIGARCFAAIEKNAGEAAAIRAAWHRVLADQHQERARWQRVMT
jgi:hypothetical protein